MSKIQLILLGQFECLLASDERIRLSMRKAEVLLAYLALAPGLRHPRERLINLLWSDRGEEQARNSLRQCLSAIKKSLGDAADLVLTVDRTTVTLKPDLIDVDALEFERLAAESDFASLSTAASLYQGEFLEGISIRDAASQDWLDGERSRFKRQFIEVLTSLGQTQLASGSTGAAIKSGERLVEQDSLGESGWRLLMNAYQENGDRSHALQAFKRCQQALHSELDVEPEKATVELRDQIAGGQLKTANRPVIASAGTIANTPVSTDHSIAVLPFDNLSGDPEQEYFSDGITESVILNLSQFPGLQVKSKNSSFAFKQQIKSIGEISRELGVDYIVEGSIRKSTQRIRITVQLVEADGGNQIWGKRYDADLADLFALEEELSRTIAATVTGRIESDLQRVALAKAAADQESYDLLLSGTHYLQKFAGPEVVIAIDKLNQCLTQDPGNARAHALLFYCHVMNWMERWVEDFQASFELAGQHALKALSLGPELGIVQVAYAEHMIFSQEYDKAAMHLEKALAINPNDIDAIATRALNLEMQGKFDLALEQSETGYKLDPHHPWNDWNLAENLFYVGRYEEALETIAISPNPPGFIRLYNVAANIKLGRTEQAREALQAFLQSARKEMLAMPKTMEEWLRYTMDNSPFEATLISQQLIDYMVEAGLEEYLESSGDTVIEAQKNISSIAVLPFDNLSGDPGQEYFSDGITESVILNLSLFPELNVKSRNSSFAFKQQIKGLGEISRELEVDYVVEGSIRKSDDRIRITVQLIEAASENQVWGKRYDAEIEDLFDLEEEMTRTIAATVTGRIDSDLQRIAIARGAAHQNSYDLLLVGIYHCNKFTRPDTIKAIEKLNQCLQQDPDNVRAHVTLFTCHLLNYLQRWVVDHPASFAQAGVHADKALSLDPENASVQAFYGEYLVFCHQSGKALDHANKALQINPNDADAITMKAFALEMMGEFEQALEWAELGRQFDPYAPWADWNLAECQIFSGQFEKALETITNSKNDPALLKMYYIVASIKLGMIEQARQALQQLLQECRNSMLSMPTTLAEWLQYSKAYTPFMDSSFNDDIIDCLVQAGLEEELVTPDVTGDSSQQPTILVLPFSNLSGDPEQEYFSDGITASLIQDLGLFNGLAVKSQQTSFAFKNSNKSSAQVAEDQEVDFLVEGSIRKSGSNVRISAQLVESSSGNQLWGKQYDSRLEDILELEQELSHTIAATISGRIGHNLQQSAGRKPTKNPRSYDYLLRGLYHMGKFTAADMQIARKEIERCLEIDPENAEAHINLAMVHSLGLWENWSSDYQLSKKLIRTHNEAAINLAPENALVHAYLAEEYLNFIRDFDQAEFHADSAIKLNPTAVEGYTVKADIMSFTRRYEKALELADQCLHLDPHSVGAGWAAGNVYMFTRDFEKSIRTYRSIPNPPASIHALTAASLVGNEQIEQAKTEMLSYQKLAREQMSNYPRSIEAWHLYWHNSWPFKFEDDFEHFFQLLLRAGLGDDIAEETDDIPSIAVLPFENMSGDVEQDYFSDGITTDIISTLSKFNHLRIVARHSILQYKNQKASISEIAEQQGVRYILEGSVRKSSNRIRVSADLIDSNNEQNCWGEHYDRDLDDLFAVQDEITRNITLAMKVHLDDGDMALHRSAGTSNIKAWQLTLEAVDLQDTYIRENILEARVMANEAINLDPGYPYAWIVLGWTYWQEAYSGWCENFEIPLAEAGKANQQAISLDPDYAEAWSQAGLIHLMKHESDKAQDACRRAVELEPGNAEIQALRAFSLIFIGEYELARSHNHNMLKLCPVLPNWYYLIGGQIEQDLGNLDESIKIYQQGIDVEPDSPLCRFYLVDALMERGDETRAIILADEIRALDRTVTGKGLVRALSKTKSIRDRFQANLAKFDLL